MSTNTSRPFGPENPFYAPSPLLFGAPPFDRITDADYQPALEAGLLEQQEEIAAIAGNPETPTFENTIVALERSGRLLDRASSAFGAVTGSNTNPELQQVQQTMAPKFAAHHDAIYLHAPLFARVKAVYESRLSAGLTGEALRLAEYYHREFVHAGANLTDVDKTELKKINEELSTLQTTFRVKLLAANQAGAWSTTNPETLAGLDSQQLAAAREVAQTRQQEGWVLPLQNTTQQPVLADLSERTTRQHIFEHSLGRTERGDANDTRETILRIAELRAQKARLLGVETFAAWKLEDQMAKTPESALEFMKSLVAKAVENAGREAVEIETVIEKRKDPHSLEAWDWEFYAAQVRKAKYDIDDAQVKPYFELNAVLLDGVFYAATRLFGLTFRQRNDLPVYHPDVRVFDVIDAEGSLLALFYGDFYKRDNKNGGAWMSSLVGQSKLLKASPIIYNVCNFNQPAAGEPALISFSDVITMFHEFGHALHGLFSEAEYPSLAGTAVPRDFVEFPSQFNEYWATHPEVFGKYVRHYKTGEPMPEDLRVKLIAAEKFNDGYRLFEVLAAAQLDMQWHTLRAGTKIEDANLFEAQALKKIQMSLGHIPPRYRSTYFAHIWGGGYAAGYYAYLWSEKLEEDGIRWFEQHGGLTRENGDRLRRMVLSRGNTADLATIFEDWLSEPQLA